MTIEINKKTIYIDNDGIGVSWMTGTKNILSIKKFHIFVTLLPRTFFSKNLRPCNAQRSFHLVFGVLAVACN